VLNFPYYYETPAETQDGIIRTRTSKILHVGSNETYITIQAAINDSSRGDTIFVYNGTYNEQLVINKDITLKGEAPESTIINIFGEDAGVYIKESQVNISGFTIIGNLDEEANGAGIELNVVHNSKITNNRIIGSTRGIYSRNSDNNIINNNEFINNYNGVFFEFSHENLIENNLLSNNTNGIHFSGSWGNYIFNNSIFENEFGIRFITDSNFNIIENNTLYSNYHTGIYVTDWSKNNTIINNTLFENNIPLAAYQCNANQILNNNCSNNEQSMSISLSYDILIMNNTMRGIKLSTCINITISNNTMTGAGIYIDAEILGMGYMDWWEAIACWNTHHINDSNIVNGKPVFYWKDRVGGVIPPNGGQIILGNCSEVEIIDQIIKNCTSGIILGFSHSNYIKNCTLTDNKYGLILTSSKNNTIINNIINNNYQAIKLYSRSNENLITNNTFHNNSIAVYSFIDSDENSIFNSSFSKNNIGIYSYFCMDNIITNNIFFNITLCDILLQMSSGHALSNNKMDQKGILLLGNHVSTWNSHMIFSSNTVSGKPIYYYSDQSNMTVPAGAGQIILANCSNMTVEKQNISGRIEGMQIGHSSENVIVENTFSANNENGIRLVSSHNNTIKNNLVQTNKDYGISFEYSDSNEFIENEIASNQKHGIHLTNSNKNQIKNNRIFSNYLDGIDVFHSEQNIIENNTIKENDQNGIINRFSNSNTIKNNIISLNNWSGIYMVDADTNRILHNIISHNNDIGYNTSSCMENILLNNTISYNEYGLFIFNGVRTRILYNNFQSNTIGIKLDHCYGYKIYYNNFINNEKQAIDDNANEWNYYYPHGGNYWDDYQGVDEYCGNEQDMPGSEGIGDSPYIINQKAKQAQDQYPLMAPVEPPENIDDFLMLIPTALENLRAVAGEGFVNLTWDPPRFEGLVRVNRYVIYRGTNVEDLSVIGRIKFDKIPMFNDTEVEAGKTYYYKITAPNWAGEGSSDVINITIPEGDDKIDSEPKESLEFRYIVLTFLICLLILFLIIRLLLRKRTKKD
jgi:parallel beta-helix repeat protein